MGKTAWLHSWEVGEQVWQGQALKVDRGVVLGCYSEAIVDSCEEICHREGMGWSDRLAGLPT